MRGVYMCVCLFAVFDCIALPQLPQLLPWWLSWQKNLPANAGGTRDAGLIPASGRSLGEGNGNPLQSSCLGKLTDRGAWWAAVHGVAKSWIQLNAHTHTHTHTHTLSLLAILLK